MYKTIVSTIFLSLTLTTLILGQKIPNKPYEEWGKEESFRIINESGWAKSHQSPAGADAAAREKIKLEQEQSRAVGAPEIYRTDRNLGAPPIRIRLHSGLQLRQAMVRLQQIDAGYDKMGDADKAKFDAGKKGYLDCAICNDYYVLTIYKDRDANRSNTEEGVFQGFTFERLKGQIRIESDTGESREIFQFNAPKNAADPAVLYFQRKDDTGKDLLNKDSKEFKIIFSAEILSARNRDAYLLPQSLSFSIPKLVIDGRLMF